MAPSRTSTAARSTAPPDAVARDLRAAVHFRIDPNVQEVFEEAVQATGLSKNAAFNEALALWASQPHVVEAMGHATAAG